MAEEKTENFEEALAGLRAAEAKIEDEKTSLEESIRAFEEGIKHYKSCANILAGAKQKIELVERELEADGEQDNVAS